MTKPVQVYVVSKEHASFTEDYYSVTEPVGYFNFKDAEAKVLAEGYVSNGDDGDFYGDFVEYVKKDEPYGEFALIYKVQAQ